MTRTSCRCCEGRCTCTRGGRPVPAPPGLALHAARPGTRTQTPAGYSGAASAARRYAYRAFATASGGAAPGNPALVLVDAYAQLAAAGRHRDAALMLAVLQRIGAQRRSAQAAAAFAALEVRVYGAAGAAQRRDQRGRRVALDRLAALVYGADNAAARRLWARVHPGQPYPCMPSPQPTPDLGSAARTAGRATHPRRTR